MQLSPCPCGFKDDYAQCCAPVHKNGAGLGATAESLVRARYSAYVLLNEPFLLETWHPDTRPNQVGFSDDLEWLGLEIVYTEAGSAFDQTGEVEFKARFRRGQERLELHELSTFERISGRWVYKDGLQP